MAVTYLATTNGSYIVLCLSSDTKPATSSNAVLLETDTGKTYYNVSSTWTLYSPSVSQPDIPVSLISPSVDEIITAGYSTYCANSYYEIADTKYLEIGGGSSFEIG